MGLKAVREAAAAVSIPIIAAGGIGSADDVRYNHPPLHVRRVESGVGTMGKTLERLYMKRSHWGPHVFITFPCELIQ